MRLTEAQMQELLREVVGWSMILYGQATVIAERYAPQPGAKLEMVSWRVQETDEAVTRTTPTSGSTCGNDG